MNEAELQRERERERQQALMSALLKRDEGVLQGWVGHAAVRAQRGMQAYQANAGASAERALAASFPTVQALVGEESFAAMARAFWHANPPLRGDLAWFGEALPAFIADSEQLADVPYLPDVARLDWLLALAERAADGKAEAATLNLLAEADPSELCIELMPGVAVLASAYPVVSLWLAHQAGDDAATHRANARNALAAGVGEQALVERAGWRGSALVVDAASARWTRSLLRGDTLSQALAEAGDGFEFEPWLVQALQRGWLMRVKQLA
jgi:hypothetical protein